MANEEANNIITTTINAINEDQLNLLQQKNYEYDVFLCFYGDDTRFNFTSTLHNALCLKRFKIFIDERSFKRGERMLPATFLKALQVSRISIVVFSKNFVTSTDRLEELNKIVETFNDRDRLILPIFYEVGRTEIMNTAEYGDHAERLQKWKSALSKATKISDYVFVDSPDGYVVEKLPRYDIFLSFSEGTRYSFANYLYDALDREGFRTCRESSQDPARSKLSIVVLCKNYADSSSCLDQLVAILDSMNTNNQLVWPIFYKVEPTIVRHKKDSYAEAMKKHGEGLEMEKVKKWKDALFEVANLKGWHLQYGYECDVVEKIVETATKI